MICLTRAVFSLALALAATAPALADLDGVVTTSTGRPVEGAQVVHDASGGRAVTDARGRFHLPAVDPPATVRVEDPRFESTSFEVGAPEGGVLPVLALTPKQMIYEEIVVSAGPGSDEVLEPLSRSTTAVAPEDVAAPTSTVADLAMAAPGVAEQGQGGRFQAYSVRGIAGLRLLTTVAGARIVSERRAGATASFVDPALLEAVEVVRGPASTYYGSGALGGVLQALPVRLEGAVVQGGYGSQGDERNVLAGWGGDGWTLALAGREAGDAETPEGTLLPSHFEQWSGLLRKEWQTASGVQFEALALPAVGRDIGKPNTRYPERITEYPEEDHLIGKFAVRWPDGWRFEAFVHPNELQTDNLRSTQRNSVVNEALDLGATGQREFAFGDGWAAVVGLDYFGRRDVTATETIELFEEGTTEVVRSLDGAEEEASAFASLRHALGRATVEGGGRFTWIGQESSGVSSNDTGGAGFIGATVPLAGGFELAANLGSGIRFPSLSERFFSGSTGRGEVIANENLKPERSLSADLGLRYYGERLFVEVFGFRNEIDDYTEQVEIEPGVETFVNLTSGTLEGFDLDGSFAMTQHWSLAWSGTRVRGESDAGSPLADVPGDRAALGARLTQGPWRGAARFEHRFAKDDPGPGELAIASADLASASLGYRFERGVTLRLYGTNLLDETYQPSADELAVPAPGRSIGVGVGWASEGRVER